MVQDVDRRPRGQGARIDRDAPAYEPCTTGPRPVPPAHERARPAARVFEHGDREYSHLEPLLVAYATTQHTERRHRELRDQLVTGYLQVARNIARRYNGRGEPLEDLEQVATIGLLKAIDRFQPDYDTPFLAYAIPTITGEVQRHFRDACWAIRVPRRLKDLHVSINNSLAELSQQLNRAPRPSDIATRLGISVEEVLEGLNAAQSYRPNSLEQPLGAAEEGFKPADVIGTVEPAIEKFIPCHALAPHMSALPERERTILIMRFYGDMTQSQIAAKIGVSQMHVSRLLCRTLAGLREAVDEDQPKGSGTSPMTDTPHTYAFSFSRPARPRSDARFGAPSTPAAAPTRNQR